MIIKQRKKQLSSFLKVLIFLSVFIWPSVILHAQFPGATADTSSIQGYIVNFYEFGLAIAGILAVGMIVAGAIFYSLSGASPDKQSEAKDMITSAIWGVVLLFGSYLILKTINPSLVVLGPPGGNILNCTKENMPPAAHPCGVNENPLDSNGNCQCYPINTIKCKDVVTNPPLNPCLPGQSELDESGKCQCVAPVPKDLACPASIAPLEPNLSNPIPIYSWLDDVSISNPSINPLPVINWSSSRCPRKAIIKTNQKFYTLDCGDWLTSASCADSWSRDNDGHTISTSTSQTTGWLWPYYPKNDSPANSRCVLYAWYDSEKEEIKKADLAGLKPCTTFSASTTLNVADPKKIQDCQSCVDFPFYIVTDILIPSKPIGVVCNPDLATSTKTCGVNSNIKTKLLALWDLTKHWNESGRQREKDAWKDLAWQVTEVWPPKGEHQDPCHYNGTCVDVALTENINCDNINAFIFFARNAGFTVGNEYPFCGGTITQNWSGGHFHLK